MRMKSNGMHIIKSFFEDPLSFVEFEGVQEHEGVAVIPFVLKGEPIDFICVNEAEDKGLIEVVETGSVGQLVVVNKSKRRVLIPFGVTVHGGKQDRTIWEPVLLPARKEHAIPLAERMGMVEVPARCVEAQRWHGGTRFKSVNKLNPQLSVASMTSQGALWSAIEEFNVDVGVPREVAPTRSYIQIMRSIQGGIDRLVKAFRSVEDQCGVAVFIKGEFVGAEFYGNTKAWTAMSGEVLRAFATEAIRTRTKNVKEETEGSYRETLLNLLKNAEVNISVRRGVALGEVAEFTSKKHRLRGIALTHEGKIVQFYIAAAKGEPKRRFFREIQRGILQLPATTSEPPPINIDNITDITEIE